MRPERRLKPGVDGGLRAASWSAHGAIYKEGDHALTVACAAPARNWFQEKGRIGCSHREADLPLLRLRRCDDRPIEGVPVSDEHNLFDTPCQGRVNERAIQ